jgi:hypothetical protein
LSQLIQLLLGGCDAAAVLKALQNMLEFRNFALTPKSIAGK